MPSNYLTGNLPLPEQLFPMGVGGSFRANPATSLVNPNPSGNSWDDWVNLVYSTQPGMYGALTAPDAQVKFGTSYNAWKQSREQVGTNQGYDQIMNQAQNAYNPENIQKYYDIAQRNINQTAANTGAYIGRQAGAHSTNMLNPSSFILGQISQSQAPYAAQTGQLQATGAQAQQSGAEGLTNLMFLLQKAKQGDKQAADQLQFQYQQLAERQREFQQQMDAQEAGWADWLFPLAGAVLGGPIGAAAGGAIFGVKKATGDQDDH